MRRFWNFLDFSHKEKSALRIAKVDSLKTAVHRTRTTLPEVVATFLGLRSPAHILHLETSAKMKRVEALVPFIKYNGSSLLLDENPIPRNAILNLTCYRTLRNVQADDFVPGVQEARQEQSARYESLQHDRSFRSARLANRRSRNLLSSPPRATRRVFSSKSCTVLQRSVETMAPSTRGSSGMPSTNVSIALLRGTRSHSGAS